MTEAVVDRLQNCPDPRLREIMTSLIRHMHAFVKETKITEEEWLAGIQFLTATGHMSNETRQEFILLSDTLGVSMLVDEINHRTSATEATESTVLGPFYVEGAPELPFGAGIARAGAPGEPVIVSGRVLDARGAPISGALLDIWHTSPDGLYDVQDTSLTEMDLRGRFRTTGDGRYEFRTTKPSSYPIPDDGPVGQMLEALGRHPWRPAHIHFKVSAEGYEPLTTHLFTDGDQYLDSDAVFAVKESLIVQYERHDSTEEAARLGLSVPFWTMSHDFRLLPLNR